MKLTMPVVESGLCEIRADGLEVGSAERLWTGTAGRSVPAYHAELWAGPAHCDMGRWESPEVADRVSAPTLRELRAELQRRLDVDGKWWQA